MPSKPERIVPDSLGWKIFYNLYDEYEGLVTSPPFGHSDGSTRLVDEVALRTQVLAAGTMLKGFELQFGISDKYRARDVLDVRSRSSSDLGMRMYEEYLRLKFWQKMLDSLLFEKPKINP